MTDQRPSDDEAPACPACARDGAGTPCRTCVRHFEELWGLRAAVQRYLRRQGLARSDAEDLLAEVYLVAWRRRGGMPRPPAAVAWLIGTAKHLLLNHRRRRRREVERIERWLVESGRPPQATAGDAGGTGLARVVAADDWARLAPGDRLVLAAVVVGADSRQLGDLLGCTPAAAAQRVARARRRLLREIETVGS